MRWARGFGASGIKVPPILGERLLPLQVLPIISSGNFNSITRIDAGSERAVSAGSLTPAPLQVSRNRPDLWSSCLQGFHSWMQWFQRALAPQLLWESGQGCVCHNWGGGPDQALATPTMTLTTLHQQCLQDKLSPAPKLKSLGSFSTTALKHFKIIHAGGRRGGLFLPEPPTPTSSPLDNPAINSQAV